MPDYGVDTESWQPLPWSWAAERLARSRNYWVITVSASGRPHAMPVWGVWDDDDHRFCFSCGPRSRKAANLAVEARIAVAPESTVEAVSLEGTAGVVTAEERRERWIERYLAKYQPVEPALSAEFLRANLVIEVAPERVLAIIEREEEFAERATRWRFPTT